MASYWCYRCLRIVSSPSQFNDDNTTCPHCDSVFTEQIETEVITATQSSSSHDRQLAFFNPIIVLRGNDNSFDLYYDDLSESGLRPIPENGLGFLMSLGFHLLLHQLSHFDLSGLSRPENLPASKARIESMPNIQISSTHVSSERHCAVCIEPFEIGVEARELPCKHLYHTDCILPWLKIKNTCPVCRHELPAKENENQDSMMGLSIWLLPGGRFAVGRYNGWRLAAGERGFQNEFADQMENETRVSRRRVGGFRRVFRGFGSFFRRFRPGNNDSSSRSRSDQSV